jgi:hypothetical protein
MDVEPTFSTDQLKSVGLRPISINRWDDYVEDGFAARGKTQKTRA